MKRIITFILVLVCFLLFGCEIKEKAANNSVNTKVVSVTDYTIESVQDALIIASEKATASVVAIVENNALTAALGSAVVFYREQVGMQYHYFAFTNFHVVDTRSSRKILRVFLGNNTSDTGLQSTEVKLEITNEDYDLAVISFYSNVEIPVCSIGDSGHLKQGQLVLAVGTPISLDNFNSVTMGIVSHPYRKNYSDNHYYIQHDASINPGNSGGGLFNLEGKLIGINTSRAVKTGEDIDGIGYAIPTDTIKAVLYQELTKKGISIN